MTEEAPPAAAPATPLWKQPLVIGGAVIIVLFGGYQMMSRGQQPPPPVDPVRPPQPPPVKPVFPVYPAVPPVDVPPAVDPQPPPVQISAPAEPQTPAGPTPVYPPQAQPEQPPVQQADATPSGPVPAPAAGQDLPILTSFEGELPMLSGALQPDGNLQVRFRVANGQDLLKGSVEVLPRWDMAEARVTFQNAAGVTVIEGAGRYRLKESRYGLMRAMQPVWLRNDVGVGELCFAFIVPKGSENVFVTGSTLCAMDETCQQALACGRVQ
ncbi:MAG: hypothetical protein EON95_14230 [Caulobacteraceae bacterium]|nr:MAG: hypothetical protein EON95_14230 [Caulobacteraceae bacterium]